MADYLSKEDQERAVKLLTQNLTRWINWVAAVLLIFFSYLELRNAPIDKITQAFDDNSFTKLALFIYFTGWAFGATDDTKIQRTAYALDPNGGNVGFAEWSGIIVFLIFFTSLFLLHTYLVWFQLFILAFILINIWTYSIVIMGRARDMIIESKEHYIAQKDYVRYLKLYSAVEYLTGAWQKKRFIVLLILALIQIALAVAIQYTNLPYIINAYSYKGISLTTLVYYLPSLLFLVFVTVAEAWMKIYRYKVLSDFQTLDEIGDHLRLSKNPKKELPPINTENLFKRKYTYHEAYK